MSSPRRTWWVLGVLLVLSVIGIAVASARIFGYDPRRSHSPLMDRPAPELELPIVAGSSTRDRLVLSSLRGKVVLFDFWASWCGPCRQSVPALNRVHNHFGDRIEMLGVNVESDRTASFVVQAHRIFGAQFPSAQDQNWQAQSRYQVQSIPTLVIVDRTGVIRWIESGVPDPEELSLRIEEMLATD